MAGSLSVSAGHSAARKRRTKGRGVRSRNGRAAAKAVPDSAAEPRLGRLSGQVGYLLRRTSNVFTAHWSLQFGNEGATITPVQCGMMILVDENPGLTQIELARLLKIEGSTLWQLVNRLLELGFIVRRRVRNDRRAFAIHLSPEGRKALRRFERGLRLHQDALLSCLSAKERTALSVMLRRVIEAGDALNAKGQAR
jgi:DNA-binding MarR family transcriptional regulator